MILHIHEYWDPRTLSLNFSLLLGPNRAQKNCKHILKILAYANAIQGFPSKCHLIIVCHLVQAISWHWTHSLYWLTGFLILITLMMTEAFMQQSFPNLISWFRKLFKVKFNPSSILVANCRNMLHDSTSYKQELYKRKGYLSAMNMHSMHVTYRSTYIWGCIWWRKHAKVGGTELHSSCICTHCIFTEKQGALAPPPPPILPPVRMPQTGSVQTS